MLPDMQPLSVFCVSLFHSAARPIHPHSNLCLLSFLSCGFHRHPQDRSGSLVNDVTEVGIPGGVGHTSRELE